jgi:hypothetical protein
MNYLQPIFQSHAAGAAHSGGAGGAGFGGFLLFAMAIVCIVSGISRLTASTDDLWERHKAALLRRGLEPARSAEWEGSARSGAWACLIMGVIILLFSIGLAASMPAQMEPSQKEQRSGTGVQGRQLTQEEGDACGKNITNCVSNLKH